MEQKKKKTIAEIWVGAMINPAYRIDVKEIRTSIDGQFILITAQDGTEFEITPHNVVILTFYE